MPTDVQESTVELFQVQAILGRCISNAHSYCIYAITRRVKQHLLRLFPPPPLPPFFLYLSFVFLRILDCNPVIYRIHYTLQSKIALNYNIYICIRRRKKIISPRVYSNLFCGWINGYRISFFLISFLRVS